MKIKGFLLKVLNAFEDLFMTNHSCVCCGREIPDGTTFMLCEKCKSKMEPISGNICQKCGDVVSAESVKVCDLCKDANYVFENNFSCFYYTDTASKIIKKYKYNSRKYYAKYIAEMMISGGFDFEKVDVITFVPMGKNRKRERGFNQAEEIAKELQKITNKEMLPLLEKVKESPNQAKLSQSERRKNLLDSFDVLKENATKIKNKKIVIIDDVFTTGTTLNECSKVLLKHKPASVRTFTFAKTKFNSPKI